MPSASSFLSMPYVTRNPERKKNVSTEKNALLIIW